MALRTGHWRNRRTGKAIAGRFEWHWPSQRFSLWFDKPVSCGNGERRRHLVLADLDFGNWTYLRDF